MVLIAKNVGSAHLSVNRECLSVRGVTFASPGAQPRESSVSK